MSRFQSLFFWNGLWDHGGGGGQHHGKRVSILVFLEWPLGPDPASSMAYFSRFATFFQAFFFNKFFSNFRRKHILCRLLFISLAGQ